jgi:hypothetical protein
VLLLVVLVVVAPTCLPERRGGRQSPVSGVSRRNFRNGPSRNREDAEARLPVAAADCRRGGIAADAAPVTPGHSPGRSVGRRAAHDGMARCQVRPTVIRSPVPP